MHALLPPKLREATYRRKRLGQWAEDTMHQWMAPELWAACAVNHGLHDADRMWVLGLDGSATGDVTALVAVSMEEIPHIEVIDYWQPTTSDPVPVLDVEEAIRIACKERQVVSIVADPFRWTGSLQVLAGEGFPVLEYPQTPGRLSPATNSFYEAVVNKALTHDGNKELALHMAHASHQIKADPRGSASSRTSRSRRGGSTWPWPRSWRSTGPRSWWGRRSRSGDRSGFDAGSVSSRSSPRRWRSRRQKTAPTMR